VGGKYKIRWSEFDKKNTTTAKKKHRPRNTLPAINGDSISAANPSVVVIAYIIPTTFHGMRSLLGGVAMAETMRGGSVVS